MKRLCLLRHAKSDWGDPSKDDFDRPLNARGEKAAAFMAGWIAHSPYKPDYILCSTAARALATCAPLCDALGGMVPVVYRDELYHAMPDEMLAEIHNAPDEAETLLVVAHNPALVLLAMALADEPATPFRVPEGIKFVRVNRTSGLRASGEGSILEAFKPGTAPPENVASFDFDYNPGWGVATPEAERSLGAGGLY